MSILNKVDTKQRVYLAQDTCNDCGGWVDEGSFNKRGTKGTLVGNWWEEKFVAPSNDETLSSENSMYFKFRDAMSKNFNTEHQAVQSHIKVPKAKSRATVFVDLEGKKRTVYLEEQSIAPTRFARDLHTHSTINHDQHPESKNTKQFESTSRTSFKHPPRPADMRGSRQKIIDAEIVKDTIEILEEENKQSQVPLPPNDAEMTFQERKNQFMAKSSKPFQFSYHKDAPITVHHDNLRENDSHTAVYATRQSGVHSFSKNCQFTTPISEYKKGKTPIE